MKKLLLILSLVLFSTPTFGEWKMVATSGTTNIYVDFERIRKKDGYLYYWELVNIVAGKKMGFDSARTYVKADCSEFKYMNLQSSFFDGQMATGTLLKTTRENIWKFPVPRSIAEIVMNKLCK